MQESKVEVTTEVQQIAAPVRAAIAKSSFNDAEYQRWSEKLRNRNRKDK